MNIAFAILQGFSPNETKDSETQGFFSRSSSSQQNLQCICGLKHLFKNYYYLNKLIKLFGGRLMHQHKQQLTKNYKKTQN